MRMSNIKSHSNLCSELDQLLKGGNSKSVIQTLRNLNARKIPRSELVRYARIANRTQGGIALRLLRPVFLSDTVSPSDEEKIEYAEALRRNGLVHEAMKILMQIDGSRYPIVHLRLAFCLVNQWRYHESIPYLKSYIAVVDSNDYSGFIARVNLGAALVFEGLYQEAVSLLEATSQEAKRKGHRLIQGNCLELLAQIFIRKGLFGPADQTLTQAKQIFANHLRYTLYVEKWMAIAKSLQLNSITPELLKCRDVAEGAKDWNSLRECDLYLGLIKRDSQILNKVYSGTPYSSFRKQVRALSKDFFEPAETFLWQRNVVRNSPARIFDAVQGKMNVSAHQLETGQLMHRLMILLSSDFYRPISVADAFSDLFPGERFDQDGSSNRIWQIVKRLRDWLQDNADGISISECNGKYRIEMQGSVGILVPVNRPELTTKSIFWKKFVSELKSDQFTKREMVKILNCSPATALRLINWAERSGHVKSSGFWNERKYQITGCG